jgi:flagellum-specific peptidoglycan hydrolase FlgJ
MKPDDFIAAIAPAAITSMHATRIPASFVIAEGALESGWGNSDLAVQGLNLFGVKAGPSWKGQVVAMRTREVEHGASVMEPALWRRYPDWDSCIADHARVLLMPRYQHAFAHCEDANAFTDAIALAGYATDPDYAKRIKVVLHQYNLTQYDKQ